MFDNSAGITNDGQNILFFLTDGGIGEGAGAEDP